MPKCPSCKKDIENLVFSARVETWGRVDLENWEDAEGNEHFNLGFDDKGHGDWDNLIFGCPECDKELFKTEEEAISFLRDNKLLEMFEKKVKNGTGG